MDRAFKRLDQLKPYLVWWTDPSASVRLLETGEALMAALPASALLAAADAKHPYALQWTGAVRFFQFWAAAADAPARALAAIATATDPVRETALFRDAKLAPAARLAVDILGKDGSADAASAPDNLARGVALDTAFWAEQGPALEARFAAWLQK